MRSRKAGWRDGKRRVGQWDGKKESGVGGQEEGGRGRGMRRRRAE